MNILYRILIIGTIATFGQLLLPWWWIVAIVAFLVELVFGKVDKLGFFSGFYGIAIPWMVLAFYIDYHNGSVLSNRVLDLFKLPRFGFVLVLVTGLLGGIVGGISSLAGSWVNAYLKHDR